MPWYYQWPNHLMLDKIGSQQQYAGKTKETAFLNGTFKWNHGVLKTTFPQEKIFGGGKTFSEIIGTEKDNAQWTGKRAPSILKTFDSTNQKKNTKSVSFAVPNSSDEEAYDYSEDDTDSDYTNSDLDDSASPSEIEEIEDAIKVKSLIKWLIKVVFAGLLLGCIVYYGVSYYFHVEEIVDNSYWGCFKRAILPQEKVVDTFWGSVKRVIFQQQQVVDNTFWGSFKRGKILKHYFRNTSLRHFTTYSIGGIDGKMIITLSDVRHSGRFNMLYPAVRIIIMELKFIKFLMLE
ncbi:hypothetical protein LOTGIDRAFT_155848 [Lottia gigantea]|uniref:Uncharacterized protein n=1 Tax=Lottia gigantea TaxID=225164 RepID=V3ZPN0_LOTGI|nr:hypothetical protein LOTGIDRAFT_155848 [Lottia gigantea]ESO82816.1 hypothetical protein LOTGIDRAFT_155848 [Lottia gigantea]